MTGMQNITVLGAGMMGPGLAQLFAVKGYNTTVWGFDNELPGVIDAIRSNLLMMSEYGIFEKDAIEPAIGRVRITSDLEEAVSKADFVEEAVVEDLGIKQDVFSKMDNICDEK